MTQTQTHAFYDQLSQRIDALHTAYIDNDQLQFIHIGTDIGMSLGEAVLAIGEPNKTQNYQQTVMNIYRHIQNNFPTTSEVDVSSYCIDLVGRSKAVDTKYGEPSEW
jgi:hypothetical protein